MMETLLCTVLDAALAGVYVAAQPSAVSSIMACAVTEDEQQAGSESLTPAQVVRAYLLAAAASNQAQAVLLDIQTAAGLYPATVPLLLQALDSQQRQQLQDTIVDLAQQQHLLQQQQDTETLDGESTEPPSPAVDIQLQPWVQQLSQLGIWDVLLLLGLWGDPQWEAGASMILLKGLRDMNSLQQISYLFQGLHTVADGAAEWLLSVGLKWATTCYIDMQVDGFCFEQAGTWLLKAGIWATPELAKQGVSQAIKQVVAEGANNSPLWQVLQYIVAKCCRAYQQEQQQQEQQQRQSHDKEQRSCNLNPAHVSSCPRTGSLDSAAAAECIQQLLAGLSVVLSNRNTEVALQFISTIKPLAAVSCEVQHTLLAAAAGQLQPRAGLQPQYLRQLQSDRQLLTIKQEMHEGNLLETATAEAAAAVAALADAAGAAVVDLGNGEQQQGQQELQQLTRFRHSWGLGPCSISKPLAGNSSASHQQQTPFTGVSSAAFAGDAGVTPVNGLTRDPPADATAAAAGTALPFLSPTATPSPAASNTSTSTATQDATAKACTRLVSQQLNCACMLQSCDLATSAHSLCELLQQAAAATFNKGTPSSTTGGQQGVSVSSTEATHSYLAPTEQLVVALVSAVLQRGRPCSSDQCQQQLVSLLHKVMGQLTPAAVQQVAQCCKQCMQHTVPVSRRDMQQARGSAAPGSTGPAAANLSQAQRGSSPRAATRANDRTGSWPMQAIWQEVLWQMVQVQVSQYCSSVPAADGSSCSPQPQGHGAGVQAACLPVVVSAVLDILSARKLATSASDSGTTAHGPETLQQPAQQQEEGQRAATPQLDPLLASSLGQLLSGLLSGDHPAVFDAADVNSCAAAVRSLLVRHRLLSMLLGWLVQYPAAGEQMAAAAIADGLLLLDDSASQQGDGCIISATQQSVAVPDAAVEVDDPRDAGDPTAVPPHQPAEPLEHASAAGTGSGTSSTLTDAVISMALHLQQLHAVHLPQALQQLLAARRKADAAKEHRLLTPTGAGPADAPANSSGQPASKLKAKKPSFQFFVVHTPAEKKPHTGQSQAQQADAAGQQERGAEQAAVRPPGDKPQDELPAYLLQLPSLPLAACQQLLQAALIKLDSMPAPLEQQVQQRGQQPGGKSRSSTQESGLNAGSNRARRSSSAAATQALTAAEAEWPSLSAHQAAGQARTSSKQLSLESAAVLHKVLRLVDISLVSIHAWVEQQAPDRQVSAACGTDAAKQAYGCAVLLLQLHSKLAGACTDESLRSFSVQQQHLRQLAAAGLSAAALLLEQWWAAGARAAEGHPWLAEAPTAQVSRQQELLVYLKHLTAALAVANPDSKLSASVGSSNALSWSDVALVFGHSLGTNSWSYMKRLQQQEQLLAVILDLLMKVYKSVQSQQEQLQQSPAASLGGAPTAAADTVISSTVADLTVLLQQLAVLNAIAGDVYGLAAAGGAASVGDPRWLLKLLVSKAQELVTGPLLSPRLISTPEAVPALVKLTQLSYLRTAVTRPGSASASPPDVPSQPSRVLPLAAHLLCMHHSPKVYAAAQTSIWGRQGLAVGEGEGPGWVIGCSREVATAAARTMLQLLLRDMQGLQGMGAAHGATPSTAGPAAAGMGLPPTKQSVQLWQGRAAAVAAICDCCELLLYQQALQAKRLQQLQQQGTSKKARSKLSNMDNSSVCDQAAGEAAADVQLVVSALAAALNGSCCAAAAHMTALLDWQIQQQQQQQPSTAELAINGAAAPGGVAAATPAAGAPEPRHSSKGARQLARKQKQAAAAAAADPVVLLPVQLSMLLGLGCAAGQLVLSKRSQLLQVQQQSQQQPCVNTKAEVQQLLQTLRAFSNAYQQLLQAVNTAAARGDSRAGVAQAVSAVLEPAAQKCAAQSRKDAWSAVAAAAAVFADDEDDSSDSDTAEDAERDGARLDPDSQHNQQDDKQAQGLKQAASADPASRFYDPEVHEELPCSEESGSDSETDQEETSSQCEGDSSQSGEETSQQQASQEPADDAELATAGMADAQLQLQRGRDVLQKVFCSRTAHLSSKRQQQRQPTLLRGQQPVVQEHAALVDARMLTPSSGHGTAAAAVAAARDAAAKARSSRQQVQQPQVHAGGRGDAAAAPGGVAERGLTAVSQQALPAVTDAAASGNTELAGPAQRGRGRPRRCLAAAVETFTATAASAAAQPSQSAQGPGSRSKGSPALGTQSSAAAGAAAKTPQAPALQQLIPVMCGEHHGSFNVSLQQVTLPDGRVVTPSALERLGGKGRCKKWRKSLRVLDADGQQGVTLARWLDSAQVTPPAAMPEGLDSDADVAHTTASAGTKRKHLDTAAGRGLPSGASDTDGPACKKQKCASAAEATLAAARKGNDSTSRAVPQPSQQKLQRPSHRSSRRVVPEPVDAQKGQGPAPKQSDHLLSRLQNKEMPRQSKQQQQEPQAAGLYGPAAARARNAFVVACLAEGKRGGATTGTGSSDDESEDDSDYSDLEDFIVVQPGKDYERMCAEAGGRLSWKRKWQQMPGARVGR